MLFSNELILKFMLRVSTFLRSFGLALKKCQQLVENNGKSFNL